MLWELQKILTGKPDNPKHFSYGPGRSRYPAIMATYALAVRDFYKD
ncbi:MAG TPA: hypothetical protein VN753_12010 [Terracidiphilus sp.]|nr:hypothetical protein [Terracidiphilus sp.]